MAMVVWDNNIQQHLMLMVMGQSSDFFSSVYLVEEWQEAKRERWVASFIEEGHSLGGAWKLVVVDIQSSRE